MGLGMNIKCACLLKNMSIHGILDRIPKFKKKEILSVLNKFAMRHVKTFPPHPFKRTITISVKGLTPCAYSICELHPFISILSCCKCK